MLLDDLLSIRRHFHFIRNTVILTAALISEFSSTYPNLYEDTCWTMIVRAITVAFLPFFWLDLASGWTFDLSLLNRREALASAVLSGALSTTAATITTAILPSWAVAVTAEEESEMIRYEIRDRKGNQDAVIREDYWYMMGRTPPRSLTGPLRLDDPQWNAFGSCETTEGGSNGNSCTYVSLKQRIPAYSKYAFNIALGAKEYRLLGKALQDAAASNADQAWDVAASYVSPLPSKSPPPPVDALLKMVLFASAVLTSPNYNGPNRELLVARFYVNEVSFATKEIRDAIQARDSRRALSAWEFGKDSWNSYFQIVNEKIVPKVGDKFKMIL